MANPGYDVFFPLPRTEDSMRCRVCNTECNVTRDEMGATGFAEAMARSTHKHDRFQCPHSETEWHTYALNLFQESEKTSSKRVRELILQDLADLLNENLKTADENTEDLLLCPGGFPGCRMVTHRVCDDFCHVCREEFERHGGKV